MLDIPYNLTLTRALPKLYLVSSLKRPLLLHPPEEAEPQHV
jgi:hypothetical protein